MPLLKEYEGDPRDFEVGNRHIDERVPVKFYMGAIKNDVKTEQEGREIYDDVECIVIYNSKDNVVDRPIRDTDKARWPRTYQAWKLTGESVPGAGGTKLEMFPAISKAQVEELKYLKIFTVEQLADLPDVTGQRIMGYQKLKALAKAYLDAAAGVAPLLEMQKQLEARDLQIANLQSQVTALVERMEGLMNLKGAAAVAGEPVISPVPIPKRK